VIGLILAGSLAGAFAFTYDKTNVKNVFDRYFAHLTTFMLILGIGLSFEIIGWVLTFIPGFNKDPIVITGILVFISILLYDFWDFLRCVIKEN
jgi:hypothetical protein